MATEKRTTEERKVIHLSQYNSLMGMEGGIEGLLEMLCLETGMGMYPSGSAIPYLYPLDKTLPAKNTHIRTWVNEFFHSHTHAGKIPDGFRYKQKGINILYILLKSYIINYL